MKTLSSCARTLEQLISSNYDCTKWTLNTKGVLDDIFSEHDHRDVGRVLAHTICASPNDPRISAENREWANGVLRADGVARVDLNCVILGCNLGLINLVVSAYRKRAT
jgi:hypothetical protein